ncbi:MAG: tRNA (adenosine(37)-N6)-dimethylallyltransferase MiaA [Clostridia bacterium]|nr:tRNA (adenosine(37)-N6)-dimethylallyltransferase MiaA [Clostridia bacterium]
MNDRKKMKTLSVLGPTASGKTGLAIGLAKALGGEIVSCDSMQLYRGMDVGTATPDREEQSGVPHYLFDIIDPEEAFSAADYARCAAPVLAEIDGRGHLPILCGGTGMYHDALMRITGFGEEERDEALVASLFAYADEHGPEALHERLAAVDPDAAVAIHPNNVRRVVRALEIWETTGRTKTEVDRAQIAGEVPYDDCPIILTFEDRALLYERIDRRVDQMMAGGLEAEARALFAPGRHVSRTAAQAIGYKEFLPYFRGECTLSDVTAAIKLATRHYAKRQMIWFRRDPDALRLAPDEGGRMKSPDRLLAEALALWEEWRSRKP